MERRFIRCLASCGKCPGKLLTGRVRLSLGKAGGHYSAILCGGSLDTGLVIRCGTPRVRVARAMFSRVAECGVILGISCLVIDGKLGRCYYRVSCGAGACLFLPRVPRCSRL